MFQCLYSINSKWNPKSIQQTQVAHYSAELYLWRVQRVEVSTLLDLVLEKRKGIFWFLWFLLSFTHMMFVSSKDNFPVKVWKYEAVVINRKTTHLKAKKNYAIVAFFLLCLFSVSDNVSAASTWPDLYWFSPVLILFNSLSVIKVNYVKVTTILVFMTSITWDERCSILRHFIQK